MTLRRDRVLGALVVALGLGIAGALVVLVHLADTTSAIRAQLHRQETTIRQLAGAVAAAQQDASAQRRLVQALQRQVRSLGGQPLTEPPTQPPAPETHSSSPAPGASPSPTPRPSPQPSTRPSPTPRPSPSPTPRPSPTTVCLPVLGCLPPIMATTPRGAFRPSV